MNLVIHSRSCARCVAGAFFLALCCSLLLGGIVPRRAALAQIPMVDPPLRQEWETVLPAEGTVRSALIDGDVVYLLTNEGIVHALAAPNGQELWRTSGWLVPQTSRCPYDPPKLRSVTHMGLSTQESVRLAVEGDLAIAALCAGWEAYQTDQQLLLLDRATGNLRGTWPVIGGRFAGVESGVMVIATQNSVYGVSLADLTEIWRIEEEQPYHAPYLEGMMAGVVLTRLDLNSRPMLTARSVENGAVLWEMPVKSDSLFRFDLGEHFFMLQREGGGDEKTLQAVDPQIGEVLWTSALPGFDGPLYWIETGVQDGIVFAYLNVSPGRVVALEAESGAELWTAGVPFGLRSVWQFGGLMYCTGTTVEGRPDELHALDEESRREVWAGLPGTELLLVSPTSSLLVVTSSRHNAPVNDAVVTGYQAR